MKRSRVAVLVMVVGCSASLSDKQDPTCEGPLGAPIKGADLTAMTACCQADMGQAHCLDAGKVPAEIQPLVATCDSGGYCIPDNFLETGASVPPATCTAFGAAGVCLSKCIPQVSQNAAALRQDTCTGADELCVPCTDPRTNMPTHACDLLELAKCVGDDTNPMPTPQCDDPNTCVYEAGCPAVIDPSTLTSCGADAHCVPAALVTDPMEAAKLGKCMDDTSLCVPDVFIETGGKFIPKTCTSVNGNEGRCLSTVIPQVAAQATLLPQDTCAATERCSPCYNPIDSTSTGACNLSCDTGPTQPAKPFAQCCNARARCVSTSLIPQDEQGKLSEQECDQTADQDLCVPVQILDNGPFPTCTASSIILGQYTGVCLSDCLDFGIQGIALARGSCDSHEKCAPCVQNGQPTGAPGCPM